MPDEDDEDVDQVFVAINPEMAWGCRVSPDTYRIYFDEDNSMTIDGESAWALLRAIVQALGEK